jgi:hypothetical protein
MMNFREGMRRLGLALGVVGSIAGGVFAYSQLLPLLEQRKQFNRFQNLLSSPAIKEAIRPLADASQGLPPPPGYKLLPEPPPGYKLDPWAVVASTPIPSDNVRAIIRDPKFQALPMEEQRKVLSKADANFAGLPPGEQDKVLLAFVSARVKPWELDWSQHGHFDVNGALKAGANEDQVLGYLHSKTPNFDVDGALNAGASKRQVIDYLAKQPFVPPPSSSGEGASEGRNIFDKLAALCGEVNGWKVNRGGIASIHFQASPSCAKGTASEVAMIETDDGEKIYKTDPPALWSYVFLGIFPAGGFLIPWGVLRTAAWIGQGFIAERKR